LADSGVTVAARTRSRPGAGARPALPVFFDPAGRRWRRIRAGVVIAVLAVAMAAAGLTALAARPQWPVPLHQASGYPAQLRPVTRPRTGTFGPSAQCPA